MVRLVRFGHPLKALVSISVTESGKVMLVNPLHSLNAYQHIFFYGFWYGYTC